MQLGEKMSKKTQITTTGVIILVFLGISVIGDTEKIEMPQCSDGIDNDGDGLADNQDDGCLFFMASTGSTQPVYCENWNDEQNPPQTLNDCA